MMGTQQAQSIHQPANDGSRQLIKSPPASHIAACLAGRLICYPPGRDSFFKTPGVDTSLAINDT